MIQQRLLADGIVTVLAKDETTGMWAHAVVPEPVGELTEESWISNDWHGYRLKMDGQVLAQWAEPIR